MANSKDDQFTDEETKRRAEQALRGGFVTPPQPLKDKTREPKLPRKGGK